MFSIPKTQTPQMISDQRIYIGPDPLAAVHYVSFIFTEHLTVYTSNLLLAIRVKFVGWNLLLVDGNGLALACLDNSASYHPFSEVSLTSKWYGTGGTRRSASKG